jgi:regulatory protein YycI of two-component signal transduction system YycFG
MNRKPADQKADADLKFRVKSSLKVDFKRCCDANDTDMSRELTAFMERYVSRNKYKLERED